MSITTTAAAKPTTNQPTVDQEGIQFPPFGPEHLTNSLHHLATLAAPTTGSQTPGG